MSSKSETQKRKIPLGRPVFNELEKEAVLKVFDSPWVLNGPKVREFEEKFKEYTGAKYASAVGSCTAGMHLSLSALGAGKDAEVLLPAFNFIADGLSVLQAGLRPVFVEVDPETGNMDPKDFEKRVSSKACAVLALHYAGFPSNMDAILRIAEKYGIKVIEDASHSAGASYGNKKIGAIGDATSFSFGPLKTLCSGMGGMVTSNDENIIKKVNSLRSYGMDKSMWDRKDEQMPWSYSISDLGHNFRMTDFQAAMGIVQLEKLDNFLRRREKIKNIYDEALSGLGVFEFFKPVSKAKPAPLYYSVKLSPKKTGLRNKLALHLLSQGIGASVHWDPPLHLHPLFQKEGCREGDFPATEDLSRRVISLPLHPMMTDEDVDFIVQIIKEFLSKR